MLWATGPLDILQEHPHLMSLNPLPCIPHLIHTLVQVTLFIPDYLLFPLYLSIPLHMQHETLTKLSCEDLAQHKTLYNSFSRSFFSFLSKFLNLYLRRIKQLTQFLSLSLCRYIPYTHYLVLTHWRLTNRIHASTAHHLSPISK